MDEHCSALELAGHAGCILLKNGAEIFRVQETMTRILDAYGVTDHNVYVISNGIFATEGEGTEHALSLVRHVPLGGVNLSRNRGHQNALLAGLMTVKDLADMTTRKPLSAARKRLFLSVR